MNPLGIEWSDPDASEELFRRVMANAIDLAWDLRVDEEALAAMYDILKLGRHRQEARGCRPRCRRTHAR
jgi:hypothetical protein